MKRFAIALIAADLLLAPSGIALAQSTAPAPANGPGQLGILQPSGVFVPVTAATSAEEAAAASAQAAKFSGKFDLTLNITIVSPIPAKNKVQCGGATVQVSGFGSGLQESIYQSVSGSQVAISGNKAVCHYVVYYLWSLLLPAVDTVNVTFTSASATDSDGNFRSTSSYNGISIKLPKNGATTTLAASLGL